MRMIIRIVLIVVLVFVAFVLTRPSTYHVERTATINAPASAVYAELDDFHRFAQWSPWEKLDPAMKKEISGPATGVGATYYWSGNSKAGEGRMTITEAQPPDSLRMRLEFLKPFKQTSTAGFRLTPRNPGTDVTWTLDGENNFMGKLFGVFMNMDKMVGADFERGLAQLKTLAEAQAAAPADSVAVQ